MRELHPLIIGVIGACTMALTDSISFGIGVVLTLMIIDGVVT